MLGSGSRRGGCGGLLAWDGVACAGWGVCGGRGAGAGRATGCGGVYDFAVVVGAGEIGDGSGRDMDGLRGGAASAGETE